MTIELAATSRLRADDRLEIRRLYKTGLFSQVQLGRQFGVSNTTISKLVADLHVVPSSLRPGPAIPPPQNHVSLPTVLLSQRQRIRGRLWWPDVATHCLHCGGLLLVRPADWDDGEIACSLCARAVATVGRELR